MAEPNLDADSSSFQRSVFLRDWWLIKCSNEFEGKRFGVAGIEIPASIETKRAMRGVFISYPIIKSFDVFTLQASDGICITLRGFLNKERVVQSGFSPEISRYFIFGFPPFWEQVCNNCFVGVPSISDNACPPFISPCKTTKGNLNDSEAEDLDKSAATVTEMNTAEINGVEDKRDDDTKGNDAEKDDCAPISYEPISPVNGGGEKPSSATPSKNATKESPTPEQRKGKVKKVSKTPLHSLSKDINNSNLSKKGEPKKSRTTRKSDRNVVEPINHSVSKVKEAKESLSREKTNRKIDFDVEVTPVKEGSKQKTNAISTDSLGQKRSRSGRVLMSPLEFWRNQIAVYDLDRNLIEVKEGHHETISTPSIARKTPDSRKRRRVKQS